MPTKREERFQRSAAQKAERERKERAKVLRSRAMIVVGVLVVIAVAIAVRRQRLAESDGRVWSSAHGHFHDRYGMEIR